MRFALVSDLHANLLALEAVLADAREAGYNRLVCLGDVATLGPCSREVLGRVRNLGCACVLGNHDEYLLEPALGANEAHIIVASEVATRAELTEADFDFLRTFERTMNLGDLFLYHATPRSHSENLLATTPPELVDEMLEGRRARIFAGGHTHIQMMRQHHGMLVVNAGSVGMPFREYAKGSAPVVMAHAEYAIVDVLPDRVSVDLRRVQLDARDLAAQLDGWDNPLADPMRSMYA